MQLCRAYTSRAFENFLGTVLILAIHYMLVSSFKGTRNKGYTMKEKQVPFQTHQSPRIMICFQSKIHTNLRHTICIDGLVVQEIYAAS